METCSLEEWRTLEGIRKQKDGFVVKKDEQQSDVLDGVPNLANVLLIHPTQHDVQSHNDPQMSLDYHLIHPLGDDEKDEQQSDVLNGC
jgi:hypothetical protein